MHRLTVMVFGLAVTTLQGCALFSTPPSVPVVEDEIGSGRYVGQDKRVGTLATVAQRRLALIKFGDGKFCAEPPPDVADNISATLSGALSGGKDAVQASAQLATAFATVAKQLFYRSQGLQLYRDGMFSLCTAYLNGAIKEEEFKQNQRELLKVANELIAAEIPHLKEMKADSSGGPTLPNPPPLGQHNPSSGSAPANGVTPPGQ
jgi:hypothetical protein